MCLKPSKPVSRIACDTISTRIGLNIAVGNFLFLAVYTVSNKNLKSKIEGNVVASLVL